MAVSSEYGRATTNVTGEWECEDCGYVRRGTLRTRPKSCPECGASAQAFAFWSDEDDDDEEDDDWDDEYDY